MEKITLYDIVNHVVLNTSDMNGIQKDVWEECFQWVVLDQASVFKNVSPALAGLEIASVWVMWYYGENMREYLSSIHTNYSSSSIKDSNTLVKIRDEICTILKSFTSLYKGELGVIDKQHNTVTASDYINFFTMAAETFQFNPNYNFGRYFGIQSRIENTPDGLRMIVRDINLKTIAKKNSKEYGDNNFDSKLSRQDTGFFQPKLNKEIMRAIVATMNIHFPKKIAFQRIIGGEKYPGFVNYYEMEEHVALDLFKLLNGKTELIRLTESLVNQETLYRLLVERDDILAFNTSTPGEGFAVYAVR